MTSTPADAMPNPEVVRAASAGAEDALLRSSSLTALLDAHRYRMLGDESLGIQDGSPLPTHATSSARAWSSGSSPRSNTWLPISVPC
jgi:hypothetical protein